MGNNVNINLSLDEKDTMSSLKTQVFKDELKNINANYPLSENQVDVKQIYLFKKENSIEVGFFIRNGFKNKILIENTPVVLQDANGNIISSKVINLKKFGTIPPYSARPYNINFEINESFNDKCEYIIKFDDKNIYNIFSTVYNEIDNIPVDITFDEENLINNFVNDLPALRTDEFTISVYKIIYNDNNRLEIVLLLRNGTNKSVNFDKLPISIVDENGLTIARKIFLSPEHEHIINPKKSRFIRLEFDISKEAYDLSNCIIVYK
jgi:SLAP domain-containing protein